MSGFIFVFNEIKRKKFIIILANDKYKFVENNNYDTKYHDRYVILQILGGTELDKQRGCTKV